MVGLLLCCLSLLKWLGQGNILFLRSFKLLFWLYVPILLLHGLMTPGTYVQTPIYLPLSSEGLHQGFYLCLHITLMFFAAILVLKVLERSDFDTVLDMYPTLGNQVKPYLLLVVSLHKGVVDTISVKHQQWKQMDSKWLSLPDMLVESIQSVLHMGKCEAKELWLHWDERFAEDKQSALEIDTITKYEVYYIGLTVLGWVTLYYG